MPIREIDGGFEGAYLVDGVFQRSLKGETLHETAEDYILAILNSKYNKGTRLLISITVDEGTDG